MPHRAERVGSSASVIAVNRARGSGPLCPVRSLALKLGPESPWAVCVFVQTAQNVSASHRSNGAYVIWTRLGNGFSRRPSAFVVEKWGDRTSRGWSDHVQGILEAQQIVRSIWEGKLRGSEDQSVGLGLGLTVPRRDYDPRYFDSSIVLFHVSWEYGCIWARPRDLNDYVWLSLLQNSKRLAVCANKEDGCPAPYFIRSKPNQKFCSDASPGSTSVQAKVVE
jgi:hypothetical protein